MNVVKVTLPAIWASALVDNTWTGLNFNAPDEAERVKNWLHSNLDLRVVSCGEESFTGQYEGKTTECLEYDCNQVALSRPAYADPD